MPLRIVEKSAFRNEVVSKSLYQFMGFCSAHSLAEDEEESEQEEEKKGTKLGIDFR